MYFVWKYYLHEVESHPQVGFFYKANIEIKTSFDPFVNHFVSLSNLMVLSTGDIKIMVSRWSRKVRQRIFVFQVILESELSHDVLDLYVLLSRK